MAKEGLPQRVMFGELVGGKDHPGGQEKDWMVHLKEGMLGLWNGVRKVAKGSKGGRQMGSTGSGGSRVIHIEMA